MNFEKNKLQHYTIPSEMISPKSAALKNIPTHRVKLGNGPTLLQPWNFTAFGQNYSMLIKRDDSYSMVASGNKLRKLEFILPSILNGQHDLIISLGPTQSNCCSVISSIAPKFGLKSAHVLIYNTCNPPPISSEEGNLFFHKLFGSKLFHLSRDEYLRFGQEKLVEDALKKLLESKESANPYVIPMGGCNLEGVFGYLECLHELEIQLEEMGENVDEIFVGVGSGTTGAGLALGKYLLKDSSILKNVKLVGYIAWDSTPSFFHKYINQVFENLGLPPVVKSEDYVMFIESKGIGYGISSAEEMELVQEVARSSGIVLDSTYTAKALFNHIKSQEFSPQRRSLFIHTGGLFSMLGRAPYGT